MVEKIDFFHKECKGVEWSGPAWFRWEKDESGYPTNLELIYFHVIDIATAGETEWNQSAFTSIIPLVITKLIADGIDPTDLLVGNIHSHHSMNSYFSSTDSEAMIEHAPDMGFWVSIIVSTSASAANSVVTNRCGAISYKGKFNRVIVDHKMKVIDETSNIDGDIYKEEVIYARKKNSERSSLIQSKIIKVKDYFTYSPLNKMGKAQLDTLKKLGKEFNTTEIIKRKDEIVFLLFKHFEYYFGVECALQEVFKLTAQEIDTIKSRFGWDYGVIPRDVKDGKKLPSDVKPDVYYSPYELDDRRFD